MLTVIHSSYPDIDVPLLYCHSKLVRKEFQWPKQRIESKSWIHYRVIYLRKLPDITFFTLKLQFLDHFAEDDFLFQNHHFLHRSPFEYPNDSIKSFIKRTSMRQVSTLEEADAILCTSDSHEQYGCKCNSRERTANLIRKHLQLLLRTSGIQSFCPKLTLTGIERKYFFWKFLKLCKNLILFQSAESFHVV